MDRILNIINHFFFSFNGGLIIPMLLFCVHLRFRKYGALRLIACLIPYFLIPFLYIIWMDPDYLATGHTWLMIWAASFFYVGWYNFSYFIWFMLAMLIIWFSFETHIQQVFFHAGAAYAMQFFETNLHSVLRYIILGGAMICTPKVGQLLEVHIFMSKKKRFNTKYSPEFKLSVIMDMRENRLSYSETARKYGLVKSSMGGAMETLHRWERIYLEEGAAGLMEERRGRKSAGRSRKQPLEKSVEEDLISENQRLKERIQYLEAENEYIKKLSALVYAEEQKSGKKRK